MEADFAKKIQQKRIQHRVSVERVVKGGNVFLAAAVLATGMAGTAMAAEKDIVEKGAQPIA